MKEWQTKKWVKYLSGVIHEKSVCAFAAGEVGYCNIVQRADDASDGFQCLFVALLSNISP